MIPPDFADRMMRLYGDAGTQWIADLPGLIADCARRWGLVVQRPFANLSFNYAAPATRQDATAVVLKIGFPNKELHTEIEALAHYNGCGIAQLYEFDAEQGAFLLERLQPGTMLSEVADDETATRIAAEVMRQLWQPPPPSHAFPTITDWSQGLDRLRKEFNGGTGPFPARLVEIAETLFTDLLASQAEQVLLHGDLHHYNILRAERQEWLAIDPKGVVGEPAYEIGALLRNPFDFLDTPNPQRKLARRVDILSEYLSLDSQRIIGWGIAQAVLSSWWSYEDEGEVWTEAVTCADLLATIGKG